MAKKDDFTWYKAALADPTKIGTDELPLHEGDVHEGYYRFRPKETMKRSVPIAFYHQAGVLCGFWNGKLIDGKEVNGTFIDAKSRTAQLFQSVCRHPVHFDAWQLAMEGGGWADEHGLGGNIQEPRDDETEFDVIMREYQSELESATDFLRAPITRKDQADSVAIWKKRLTGLKARADDLRVKEKQPHLDAGRAVDDKYRPIIGGAEDIVKRLVAHLKPFMDKLDREEKERQRKAQEDADRIRREAEARDREAREAQEKAEREAQEEAERAAAEMDTVGGDDPEAETRARIAADNAAAAQREADDLRAARERQAEEDRNRIAAAEREAQERKVQAGRVGAKVAKKTKKVAKVEDFVKVATALLAMNDVALKEVIQKRADDAAAKGFAIDGMVIVDDVTYV